MLQVLISKQEKAKAQATFRRIIEDTLRSQGKLNVGYPGGNETIELFSDGDGDVWYGGQIVNKVEIPRYWNAFGIFDPSRSSQTISVELNIPIDTNSQRVSGFFARDTATKKLYLMHSGRIGGGKKGVGKGAYLSWSRNRLAGAFDPEADKERYGIVIGALNPGTLVGRIRRFTKQVALFKELVRKDRLGPEDTKDEGIDLDGFTPEFSGQKNGYTGGTLDYFSYHGDVISELHKRRSETKSPAEVIFNNGLIDLGVRVNGILTEVYEAKTSVGRQALYTAIGQLLVHSGGERKTRKFLVLPGDEDIADDVANALRSLDISIWKFSLLPDCARRSMATRVSG
jgi:hypothetical protein